MAGRYEKNHGPCYRRPGSLPGDVQEASAQLESTRRLRSERMRRNAMRVEFRSISATARNHSSPSFVAPVLIAAG